MKKLLTLILAVCAAAAWCDVKIPPEPQLIKPVKAVKPVKAEATVRAAKPERVTKPTFAPVSKVAIRKKLSFSCVESCGGHEWPLIP